MMQLQYLFFLNDVVDVLQVYVEYEIENWYYVYVDCLGYVDYVKVMFIKLCYQFQYCCFFCIYFGKMIRFQFVFDSFFGEDEVYFFNY